MTEGRYNQDIGLTQEIIRRNGTRISSKCTIYGSARPVADEALEPVSIRIYNQLDREDDGEEEIELVVKLSKSRCVSVS